MRHRVDRDFVAGVPNRCRVADFTRVKARAGVVHVAFVVVVTTKPQVAPHD
ncbi:hypothetical protein ACE14D_03605 [Streptomyces sp. Act-28]